MTGLLESTVRKLSFVWTHDRSVRSFSRLRKSPAGLAFKATEKLDPDVRELLSTHCSWCVLDCGEAQYCATRIRSFTAKPTPIISAPALSSVALSRACSTDRKSTRLNSSHLGISYAV